MARPLLNSSAMAAQQRIRGLFSEHDQLPRAREDESGLRPIPSRRSRAEQSASGTGSLPPVQLLDAEDLFEDLPTAVYEPANEVSSRGLADLLEPAKPPPPPGRRPPGTVSLPPPGSHARRRRRANGTSSERVDLDAVIAHTLPAPAWDGRSNVRTGGRPMLARLALATSALLAGALALVAAAVLTAPSEPAQADSAAAPTPAAAPATVQSEPSAPAPSRIVLEDILISVPTAARPTGEAGPARAQAPAARQSASAAALPDLPSREQVVAALRPLEEDVRACAEGHGGVAHVRIAVHPSGRVTTATVTEGSVVGTPAGSCIARTLRRADFPRFQQQQLVVQYPFRL